MHTRCIQAKTYAQSKDGPGTKEAIIADKDRKIFYTDNGRPVRDGGGIEPDVVFPAPKVHGAGVLMIVRDPCHSCAGARFVSAHEVVCLWMCAFPVLFSRVANELCPSHAGRAVGGEPPKMGGILQVCRRDLQNIA